MKKIRAKTADGEVVTAYVHRRKIDVSTLMDGPRYIEDIPEYLYQGRRMNRRGNSLISPDDEIVLTILEE